MAFTESDIARAVSIIRSEAPSKDDLDYVDAIVDGGEASQLVSKLVSSEAGCGKDEYDVLCQVMRHLEALAERSEFTAIVLMLCLDPFARKLFAHDIRDAINLWIINVDSARVTPFLNRLALDETDANSRRHYEMLIENRRRLNKKE